MIKYYAYLDTDILMKGENDGEIYKLDKAVEIKEYKTCDTLATAEPQKDGCFSFETEKDYGEVAFVGVGYCDEDSRDKSNVVQALWLMTEEEAKTDLNWGSQGDFDCYYRVCKEGFVVGPSGRFVRKEDVQVVEQDNKKSYLAYKYVDNDCFDAEYPCGSYGCGSDKLCVNKENINIVAKPEAKDYRPKKLNLVLDAQTYFDMKGSVPLVWDYAPIFYENTLVGYGYNNNFKIFGSFPNEVCLRIVASYNEGVLMVEYLEIDTKEDRERSDTDNDFLLWCEVED